MGLGGGVLSLVLCTAHRGCAGAAFGGCDQLVATIMARPRERLSYCNRWCFCWLGRPVLTSLPFVVARPPL
jgi:hypothetical protein